MPSRNSVKTYLENTYYHIYNRGVEGRTIFCDTQDYRVFLSFLKRYLTPVTKNEVRPRWKIDLPDKLLLTAYCLMPNHFHLLIKQIDKDTMTTFMRSLMNSYVKYFNKKYKRIGGLFQGKYKAVFIEDDDYLIHLTRYIHLNPLELTQIGITDLEDYFSSYGEYTGKRKTSWIHPEDILGYFSSTMKNDLKNFRSYKDFVEQYKQDPKELVSELILE